MKARTQEDFKKDWTGCVDVRTGDSAAKFTSIDTNKDGKVKLFSDGTDSIRVNIKDLPKAAQRVIKPGMKEAKKFRIRLDAEDGEVKTVTPYSGVFRAKLEGLGPKTKEGEYRLIEKTYNKGEKTENTHQEFLAIYKIVDGVFRDVELPGFYLHYKFEEVPEGLEDEGFTQFNTVDTPQASQLHKLQAWAEVHGNILDEPIRWSDDGIILPELEERALDNDRDVNLVFEKGYIKSVQPVEDYEEVTVESEDETVDEVDKAFPPAEEVKPAKPAKKSTKALVNRNKPVAVGDVEDDL